MRAAALLLVLTVAGDPGLTDLDRRVEASLSAIHEEGPVVVHYDPAALSEGWAAKEGRRALDALRLLEARLDVPWEGRAHVFLHRDEESFRAATGAPAAWGAFASGPRSLHLPRGAPVVHEMTHLVAHRIPGCEGRDPGGFLREGLAAAMEGEDRSIPVASWAAVYARLGILPAPGELRARWPEGEPRGPHPYHVAGAYVAWLLETRGAAKVKELYAAPDRVEEILGSPWAALDGEFALRLLLLSVPDAEEDAVRRGLGLPAARLPDALAKGRAEDLLAGAPDRGWTALRPEAWTPGERGGLRGASSEGWAILETKRRLPPGTALRLRVRAGAGASPLLRQHRTEEGSAEALLTPGGGLLTVGGGAEGFAGTEVRLVPDRATEVILHAEGTTARLYLDGRLVREVEEAFRPAEGALGIGVSGGEVEVEEAAAVLPLPR